MLEFNNLATKLVSSFPPMKRILQTLDLSEEANCINGILFLFLTGTDWYPSYKLPVEHWEPSSLPVDRKKGKKWKSRVNYIILAINLKYKRR